MISLLKLIFYSIVAVYYQGRIDRLDKTLNTPKTDYFLFDFKERERLRACLIEQKQKKEKWDTKIEQYKSR